MGNQRQYRSDGGFTDYLFKTDTRFEPFVENGLQAKVIESIDPNPNVPRQLPQYSNTSVVYLLADTKGEVIQCRVYDKQSRRPILDFDWSHLHTNTNGKEFPPDIVHVHPWGLNSRGEYKRSNYAHYMTDIEFTRYGSIIHHFNKEVKLKP